jgi:hypothetical protein
VKKLNKYFLIGFENFNGVYKKKLYWQFDPEEKPNFLEKIINFSNKL